MGNSGEADADAIRTRMAGLRSALDEDVQGIVQNAHDVVQSAQQLTDWRYYVRAAPWGSVAAVAALGYLAVPRRVEIVSPDAAELAKLAKQNRLVVGSNPEPKKKGSGPLQMVLTMAANAAMRAAMAYASQQAGKFMGQEAATDDDGRHEAHRAGVRS